MKKKVFSIIVVAVLLVTMLSGCSLITLNADRDGAQVVATVDVNGMQGVVTKVDLMNYFNQVGYLYIQYYGWTVEKVVNEFADSLAKREILVLHAMQEIGKDKGVSLDEMTKANNDYVNNILKNGTDKYDSKMRPYDLFALLGYDEQFYVIKQTKKAFESSFETLVEEVEAEIEANTPAPDEDEDEDTEEEEEDKTLEPRKQKEKSTDDTFKADPSITAEAVAAEKTFFEEMDEKNKNKEFTEAEQEAYNRMKKNILKNYDTIDIAWYNALDSQSEARLLEKYKDEYINKGIAATEEEILSRYNYTITNNLTSVYDKDSYKTAIEADKENSLLVHNEQNGYFTVQSILLKFSDDQANALKAIQSGAVCDTDDKQAVYDLREQLARDDAFGVAGFGEDIGGIKVNVSNPDYDPEAQCNNKDCTCVACPNSKNYVKNKECEDKNCQCVECVHAAYDRYDIDYNEILKEMSLDLKKAQDGLIFADSLNLTDEEKAAARLNAKMDMFDDYIYLVNDDDGMFNSTGYVLNMNGESSYVAEYVALARALAKKAMDGNTVGVVGGLGETTVANPFDDKAPEIKIHSFNTDGGEEINYIVNDYGIHIIMVTYVPCDEEKSTEYNGQYILNKDYVVSYENVYKTDDDGNVVLDEKGNKTLVEFKNKTVNDVLADTITEEKKSVNYTEKEKEIIESDQYKKTINEKVVKQIIKEIEKSLG